MKPAPDSYKSYRTPWAGFPSLIRNGDLGSMQDDPDYMPAKAGDTQAALSLADRLINDETVEAITAVVDGTPGEVRILPVLAQEATGRNKIPLAAANVIAHRLGLTVENRIVQSICVRRTGSDSSHRLANVPAFTGEVDGGVSYILVDDTASMGGTLAALRGYVEHHGARAILGLALTAHDNALQIAPDDSLIQQIYKKHGQDIQSYWQDTFGYSVECLTRAEAGHVLAARSLVALRDRIAQARDAALQPRDGRAAQEGPELKAQKTSQAFDLALTRYLIRLPADSAARKQISDFSAKQSLTLHEAVTFLLSNEKKRVLRLALFDSFKLPEVGGAGDALKHAHREMTRAERALTGSAPETARVLASPVRSKP